MLRTVKPRNARSKRALEEKESKLEENAKQALFLKSTTTGQVVNTALVDILALKKPDAKSFEKKNALHPFDDVSSLEFFSEKNDTSLIVFGSHSKKRPHNLTWIRTFGYRLLDMIELYIVNSKSIAEFDGVKAAVGLKPMMLFSGPLFDSHSSYQHVKSLFLDFFRGEHVSSLDVRSLQYLISVSADEASDKNSLPLIHFRVYLLRTKKSGQKVPRVELDEMGPSFDFRIGRVISASDEMMKEALKRPKLAAPKTKKNIETDLRGDKLGRIHVGAQDLKKMQTRKMKGLKRDAEDNSSESRGIQQKRLRR